MFGKYKNPDLVTKLYDERMPISDNVFEIVLTFFKTQSPIGAIMALAFRNVRLDQNRVLKMRPRDSMNPEKKNKLIYG